MMKRKLKEARKLNELRFRKVTTFRATYMGVKLELRRKE
jgi:hypothetical protein